MAWSGVTPNQSGCCDYYVLEVGNEATGMRQFVQSVYRTSGSASLTTNKSNAKQYNNLLEANNDIDILLRWVRMNGNYITTRAVW